MNWEIGIDMYTLICIKQITNKNLLYIYIKKKDVLQKKNHVFKHDRLITSKNHLSTPSRL